MNVEYLLFDTVDTKDTKEYKQQFLQSDFIVDWQKLAKNYRWQYSRINEVIRMYREYNGGKQGGNTIFLCGSQKGYFGWEKIVSTSRVAK